MPMIEGAKLVCDSCGASKFARRINMYSLDPKETQGWKVDGYGAFGSVLCPTCAREAKKIFEYNRVEEKEE